MTLEKIAQKIPASQQGAVFEKLVDVILTSKNADKMPSDLAKTILHSWQRNQLVTEAGLHRLLDASMLLEPEKTIGIMEELGLQEIATMLKETPK